MVLDATQKRELCHEIADVYREKIMNIKNVQEPNYRSSIYPQFLIGNIAIGFTKIFNSFNTDDLEKKARKYDGLADSKVRIYFILMSNLQETLKRLRS